MSNGSIDCRNFEDRIHQILDDRLTLTGDDLLMAHVANCADCEKIFNDYDSVDDSIKLLPGDLAHILNKAEQPTPAPFASRTMVLAASLAAMVVISLNIFNAISTINVSETAQTDSQIAAAPYLANAPKGISNDLAIATPITSNNVRMTPDSSPFSRNFSMVQSMPMIPAVPSWRDISRSLDPLEPTVIDPVLSYSSKIPAVRPVHCSVNATISVLRHSFEESKSNKKRKPDLGLTIDPRMLAAV